jgi:hypothetical protein
MTERDEQISVEIDESSQTGQKQEEQEIIGPELDESDRTGQQQHEQQIQVEPHLLEEDEQQYSEEIRVLLLNF